MSAALWGGDWYLANAKDRLDTIVTSINGTILVTPPNADAPLPVLRSNQLAVAESTIISTDETSQATLTFYDDSTITLYSNTTLVIQHSNRSRFNWRSPRDLIEVELQRGRIRATSTKQNERRIFAINTIYGQTKLTTGSYSIEVNEAQTQVSTRLGLAQLTAQNTTVQIQAGQLSTVKPNEPPAAAIAAEQNLLLNGDFQAGLDEAWQLDIFVPENTADRISATAQVKSIGGRPVVEFTSQGVDNIHTEVGIEQVINKDVQDFQSLRIDADIRLIYQSLPGGGQLGSEFPIFIKLTYKDAEGNDRDWYHGFYYETPPGNYLLYDLPDNSSENISQNIWYPYESDNLLALLGENKPVYVKSIRIYSSGWIYTAMIADVKLLAQD